MCQAAVRGAGRWGSFHKSNCKRKAQPGKLFCKTHDPDIKAEKDKQWMEDFDKSSQEQRRLKDLFPSRFGFWVKLEKTGMHKVEFRASEEDIKKIADKLKEIYE